MKSGYYLTTAAKSIILTKSEAPISNFIILGHHLGSIYIPFPSSLLTFNGSSAISLILQADGVL